MPPARGGRVQAPPFPDPGETLRPTRSNLPYLIAAAGGVLLFISLFLSWISVGGATASGWEVFSIVDVVLALLAAIGAAIGVSIVTGTELPVPGLRPELLKWVGVVALTIVLTYLLESDHLGFGVFVALVGAVGILGGAILAERPDLAGRLAEAAGVPDDTRPVAAPPSGLGGRASTAASGTPPAARAQPRAARPATSESPTSVQPSSGVGGAAASSVGGGAARAAEPAQSSGPPAGWYPDPQGQARLRYWDGNAWTDQTSG
jgi:uncharacterized protein DUF2510